MSGTRFTDCGDVGGDWLRVSAGTNKFVTAVRVGRWLKNVVGRGIPLGAKSWAGVRWHMGRWIEGKDGGPGA